MRPCLRRSSGMKPMPARMAARGLCAGSTRPPTVTVPASYRSIPKTARAISLRPAPTRPARPTISPARTVKEMSWKVPRDCSPLTSSTTSPISAGVLGNRSPTSRPTIRSTIASTSVSAMASVEMYSPSRITVTVSQSANTSSKRWEMKTRARPSSRRLRATAKSRSTSTPLRAAVGSSMTSRLASSEMALAISMICWSAIERPRAGRRGSMRTPSRAKSDSASAYIAARSMRPAAAVRLAAHEDVLGDRQVGEERGLLVDHRDAGGLGGGGRGEVDVRAAEPEDAGVALVDAGHDLDQRRLAGAVLADQGVDGAGRRRPASPTAARGPSRTPWRRRAARAPADRRRRGIRTTRVLLGD